MSTPEPSGRRTPLKHLSLSLSLPSREHLSSSSTSNTAGGHSLEHHTPVRSCANASAGSSSCSGLAARAASPLSASTSRNRTVARPLSLYSSLSAVTAAAGALSTAEHLQHTPVKSGASLFQHAAPNSAPVPTLHHDKWPTTPSPLHSARELRQLHALTAADADCLSTASEAVNRPVRVSQDVARRRSLLGRSHSRKQSSISYARSPSASGTVSPAASCGPPFNPRSALPAARYRPLTPDILQSLAAEESMLLDASDFDNVTLRTAVVHPSPADNDGQNPQVHTGDTSTDAAEISASLAATSLSTDLLTFIAKKERKCMDLREELHRNEEELAGLKKKWESIMQRELAAALPTDSSKPTSPAPENAAGLGLLSSLTASFTATASPSTAFMSRESHSYKHRLLSTGNSISITSSPAAEVDEAVDFKALADMSVVEQHLGHTDSDGSDLNSHYDVGKLARSWLGGIARSASSMLETIAPPAQGSAFDLGTVQEEDEYDDARVTAAKFSRPTGPASVSMKEGRRASSFTVSSSAESGSPSSCNDEGRFSSNASRSSSISSLDSSADRRTDVLTVMQTAHGIRKVNSGKLAASKRSTHEDTTPDATPTLPQRATSKGHVHPSDDGLWAFGDDFENSTARKDREALERKRICTQEAIHLRAPRSPRMSSPIHTRRRSTAFEIGGTWGTMVGRKWSEVANSETFKLSKQATLNFVDSVEKTLTDAITIDAPIAGSGTSRHRSSSTILSASGDVVTIDTIPSRRTSSTSSTPLTTNSWNSLTRSSQSKRARHVPTDNAGDIGNIAISPPSVKPGPPQNASSRATVSHRTAATGAAKHSKRSSTSKGSTITIAAAHRPLRSPLIHAAEDTGAESEEAWGW